MFEGLNEEMFIQFSSLLPQITQQLPNDQSINNNIVLSSALTNKQLNQHHNIGVDSVKKFFF